MSLAYAPVDDPALDRERLRVVIITMVINLASLLLFAYYPGSDWKTAVFGNVLCNGFIAWHIIRRKDNLMWHLVLFGLAAGFMELIADAWLVDVTHTLDYSIGGGPMLWRSPAYMPFAWEVGAVEFGYIGMRLFERYGMKGLFAIAPLGSLYAPFYEERALAVGWWAYGNCRMLSHTPYYIIGAELFITMCMGFAARNIRHENYAKSIGWGVFVGVSILVFYVLAFLVFDGWPY